MQQESKWGNLDINKSYIGISPFFEKWVKLFEYHLRKREVEDSHLGDERVLILSPPTDPGIILLAESNRKGETIFLCPTDRIEAIAYGYARKKKIDNVNMVLSNLEQAGFDSGYFDIVFANCYFDFCPHEEVMRSIRKINDILKKGGLLFSVHMDIPCGWLGKLWSGIFQYVPAISRGCHPVEIDDFLINEYTIIKNIRESRYGFPLRYLMAMRR